MLNLCYLYLAGRSPTTTAAYATAAHTTANTTTNTTADTTAHTTTTARSASARFHSSPVILSNRHVVSTPATSTARMSFSLRSTTARVVAALSSVVFSVRTAGLAHRRLSSSVFGQVVAERNTALIGV